MIKKTHTDVDIETGEVKKATTVSEFDKASGNITSQKRTEFDESGTKVKKKTDLVLDEFDAETKKRSGTLLEYEGDNPEAKKRTLVDVDESVEGKPVRTDTELAGTDPESKPTKKTVYEQDRVKSQVDLDPDTSAPKKTLNYDYDPETGRQKSMTELDPVTKKQNRLEFDTDGTSIKRSVDFNDGKLAQVTDTETGKVLSYELDDGKFKAAGSIDTVGGGSRGFRQGNKLGMEDVIKRGGTNGVDFKKLPAPDEPKFRTTSGDVDINSGKVASGAGDGKFSTAGRGILAGLGTLATMALLGGGITLISTAALELTNSSDCSGKPNPEMTFACHLGVAESELISLIDEYQTMIETRDEIIASSKKED